MHKEQGDPAGERQGKTCLEVFFAPPVTFFRSRLILASSEVSHESCSAQSLFHVLFALKYVQRLALELGWNLVAFDSNSRAQGPISERVMSE